jgi:hypothetical protein
METQTFLVPNGLTSRVKADDLPVSTLGHELQFKFDIRWQNGRIAQRARDGGTPAGVTAQGSVSGQLAAAHSLFGSHV